MREDMAELNQYVVWHEKGGYIVVPAKNPTDAIEQFYDCIASIVGHSDRSKVVRPKDVVLFDGDWASLINRPPRKYEDEDDGN